MQSFWKVKKSLARKMMIWFMIVVLVPIISLSILLYRSAYNRYYEKMMLDKRSVLSAVAESIENNVRLVENVVDSICYDTNIINLLANEHTSDYNRVVQQLYGVQSLITKSEFFLSDLLGDIVLFADNEFVHESYWYVLNTNCATDTADYIRFMNKNQTSGWIGNAMIYPADTVLFANDNQEMFCYYKQIYSGIANRIGLVKCGVNPDRFFSSTISTQEGEEFFIVMDDQVVYGANANDVMLSDTYDTLNTMQCDYKYLYISQTIKDMDNISLVMSVDGRDALSRAVLYALPLLLIALGAGAVMSIATQRFLHSINKRINQAVNLAKTAKHNCSMISLPDQEKDEVSLLIDSFNILIMQLQQDAQERILHEQREKKALQLALQYQINPHFLFNTLNWIQMSIELGIDYKTISEWAVLLGRILRYNLEEGAFASLLQETNCAKDYVRLMNMRKHGLISLEIHQENIQPDATIMRFILQPMCENAIQHGMIPSQPLHIQINVIKDKNGITVRVCNDGAKIPPKKLKQLVERIHSETHDYGIGLINIYSRIKLLYGASSALTILSENQMTCVELFLENVKTSSEYEVKR